jgi:hypothetical protein
MEKIARIPVGHLSVKAEREQLLHARFITFDGKSDQGDIKARLAPAGSARVLGVCQYDSADPKAVPAPSEFDSTLRVDAVRSTSIAFVQAGEEINESDLIAVGAGGKAIKADSATKAEAKTGAVGENNALTYTANEAGDEGNALSIALIDPAGANKALAVNVDGHEIKVSLATDGANAITTTAAQVIAAIAEHDTASQLIAAANTGASNGTGKVKAVAKTALAGGADSANAVAQAFTEGDADDYIEVEVF